MGDFMAKLKKAKLSMNNKEKSFAYEIIGIVSLLIALISIARFGLVGKYLVLAFSLLFGDWYFVFIALVGIFGVYCLVFHKKVELKSVRYYGIILILLSLLIISHFGMHDYVVQFEGNALKTTLNLYFEYFKSSSTSMIKGGGIVGCLCFYIAYYMLGKVGTVLISLILMFVGVVFLSKKTIREFFEMIIIIVKKVLKFVRRRFVSVVDNVIEISKDYNNKHIPLKKRLSKKEKQQNEVVEVERCEEIVSILKETFNHLDIEVSSITYLICEHIIVYFLRTKQEVNYKVLEMSLQNKINDNFLIKYDKYNEQLILEINKKDASCLSFKKAKKEMPKDASAIVLGIDDRNLLVELDDNLLICSKNINLMKKYLLSIMTFCTLQKKFNKDKFTLIDVNGFLKDYTLNNLTVISDIDYLSKIVEEIDQNLELLNLHHKKDIEEYNLFYQAKIQKKTYFIVGIEHIVYKKGYFDKLLYIVQTCKMAGINVILSVCENVSFSNILLGSINKKVILENDFDFSNKMIDNTYFEILNNNIEGFYKDKDLIIRISLLMMSEEEFKQYVTVK